MIAKKRAFFPRRPQRNRPRTGGPAFTGAIAPLFLICLAGLALPWLTGCENKDVLSLGNDIIVAEFSSEFQDFQAAVHTDFSRNIMEQLAVLGDDPVTGNRSAASPAEQEAADIMEAAMWDAGLENVTREAATADGWTFTGAALVYENRRGAQETIALGGYAANLTVAEEALLLVDAGRGTEADYAKLDVTGKLVLIDMDPRDWPVRYPAYQARLKGAKGVVVRTLSETGNEEQIRAQDFRGPSDAPALAISGKDADALRTALRRAENGELPVVLSARSIVAGGAQTTNLWGEIPGRTEDVIYMIGNYDGFFHSAFDNAAGISATLGIAKALTDSGFIPDKTIRFVAHGAGEWGAVNTAYDWGIGAWRQIAALHPEWAESAFAVLNLDGAHPTAFETHFGISVSEELYPFVSRSAGQLIQNSMYSFAWYAPTSPAALLTEAFTWTLQGVPMVTAAAGESASYYEEFHHSSADSVEAAGFDDDAYRFNHVLYGKLIIDLDDILVRPMSFPDRIRSFRSSLRGAAVDGTLSAALSRAEETAVRLTMAIDGMNLDYFSTTETARPVMEATALGLNRELYRLYREMQDDFLRLTWQDAAAYPHENTLANVLLLRQARDQLQTKDAAAALETLKQIDLGRYAAAFDRPTCAYFAGPDYAEAWAEGRRARPPCPVDDTIRSLVQKIDADATVFQEELRQTEALLIREEVYLRELMEEEARRLDEVNAHMEGVLSEYFSAYAAGDAAEN